MCYLIAYILVGQVVTEGQLTTEQYSMLIRQLDEGGDPHQAAIALLGIGEKTRNADDMGKYKAIEQAVLMASAILKTLDRTVPVDRKMARSPDFDATKFGGKPILAGADPKSISDPIVRKAYEKALSEHSALMERVSRERNKLREAEYCLTWTSEMIGILDDKPAILAGLGATINNLKVESWIKEKLRSELDIETPTPAPNVEMPGEPSSDKVEKKHGALAPTGETPSVQSLPPTISKSPAEDPQGRSKLVLIWGLAVAVSVAIGWIVMRSKRG